METVSPLTVELLWAIVWPHWRAVIENIGLALVVVVVVKKTVAKPQQSMVAVGSLPARVERAKGAEMLEE